ncbi:hypothetical protein CHARACLAT_029907, partial [Characodon lateralis]|nr:hypothetical protein [Characodon lateralis]
MEDDEKPVLKGPKMNDTSTLIRCISPWAELQSAEDIKKGALKESGQTLTNEEEELVALTQITQSPLHQTSLIPDMAQSGTLENSKNAVKASSPSQTPSLSHLHGSNVIDITDDAQATVDQESSEAVSALLASQKDESVALSPYLPLNSSPISSPPIPTSPSPSEGSRRMDVDSVMKPAGVIGGSVKSPKSFNSKIEFATTEGLRPAPSIADNTPLMDKEKTVLSHLQLHHHQQQQLHEQQHTSVHHGVPPPLTEESRKTPQQQIPFNKSTPPDLAKSKVSLSSTPSTVQLDSLKQKPQPPNQPYPSTNPADLRAKPHPGLLDISKPKTNTSPEVSKHKVLRYSDSSPSPSGRLPIKVDLAEPPRSGFKPVPLRAGVGGVSTSSSTKSPLIYDKNETFTVYRDPALVRSDTENSVTQTNSPNHMTAYLHPHLHTLHSPSPHSTCLTSASHPHGTSHLLAPPHSSPLPHPHLLPPGMLSAMHPPPGTLFGGHPRLDAPGSLSHLALPHPATTHQQQFLQSHGGAAGLGLYPIIWPYPNGTPPPYAPGLNLPSTAKWVHSENPITVNSEASLRR